MQPKPQFGARVLVSDVYRRRKEKQRDGYANSWKAHAITPRVAIYIGYRTLYDGRVDYDEYGSGEFCPKSHFSAALVVFSERTRPVLVPFAALEVINDAD